MESASAFVDVSVAYNRKRRIVSTCRSNNEVTGVSYLRREEASILSLGVAHHLSLRHG